MSSYTKILESYLSTSHHQHSEQPTNQFNLDYSAAQVLRSEEPRGTTLSLDYRPLHRQQQQQKQDNQNNLDRMSAYSSQKHFSKEQFGKSLQQSLLSPQLQKSVIHDALEDEDDAKSILKQRNEHVSQMIDSLFSAQKNDELDSEPVKQKNFSESLKFNKSPSKASLSKIIQQKKTNERDWLETPLLTDISKRPYMNTISYLSDKGPNRASSPHLEFLPVKDTSKNEYNIDEYLPQKSFLKTTENQILTNTLMSSFAHQNNLERSKPDTASFTKQTSLLDRPDLTQNRSNILKTNLSDTLVQRATSPYRNRIASPEKRMGYDHRRDQDLRFVFENILRQYNIQENPQLVANLLLSTVTQYRDQDSQSVHSRLNTENERSQYQRNNTSIERIRSYGGTRGGGQRLATNLEFERANAIEFIPARGKQSQGSGYQARVIVHPGSKRTESDQLSFQADRRTEESFRSNERPTWQEYVSPKSTNILNKQLSPSRPYDSIKIRDDSQALSRNKSGSKHHRHPSSIQSRRFEKTSPQRDEQVVGYKNIRANIESSFLESLQQSHQKFSSHLKHRVETLKTEGSTTPLAELNKLNSPNAQNELKVSELRKNISPSASSSQYQNNAKTIPRSPTHTFNKSQRSQAENKENQNFDQTRNLKKSLSGFEKSPMRSVNSEYKKKWTNVKFFENEDLDLLIKSYI